MHKTILIFSLLILPCTLFADDDHVHNETCQHHHDEATDDPNILSNIKLDASIIIDTYYHHDDTGEGISHLLDEIAGFSHDHDSGSHDHGHTEVDNGFNFRYIEIGLSGEVDPYFRAWTTLVIDEHDIEIEEAAIQTTSLPWNLTLTGGKFFSGIGRINHQHPHEWDFFDQPLIYKALFGTHGLMEKGVQLTYLADTPYHLLFGIEAFNGDNEKLFEHVDADQLPERKAPRLFTGFVKMAPDLGDHHAMHFGLSYANGAAQEEHDDNDDGTNDHWLDGRTSLCGADFKYKYDAERKHGQGDVIIQGEYFYRHRDMDIEQHDLTPSLRGQSKEQKQDGYYIQALYGFAPRWRTGVRWDQIGLTNKDKHPDGSSDNFGSSNRITLMTDWKLSNSSLLRFQTAHFDLELEDENQNGWEFVLQWQIAFGGHPDHH